MPVRCAGETAHVFGSRKKEDICVLASQGIQVCTVKPGQMTNSVSVNFTLLAWVELERFIAKVINQW